MKEELKREIRKEIAINLVKEYSRFFYEGSGKVEILYISEDPKDLIMVKHFYSGPLGIETYKFYVDIYNKKIYTYESGYFNDCIKVAMDINDIKPNDNKMVQWKKILDHIYCEYIFE